MAADLPDFHLPHAENSSDMVRVYFRVNEASVEVTPELANDLLDSSYGIEVESAEVAITNHFKPAGPGRKLKFEVEHADRLPLGPTDPMNLMVEMHSARNEIANKLRCPFCFATFTSENLREALLGRGHQDGCMFARYHNEPEPQQYVVVTLWSNGWVEHVVGPFDNYREAEQRVRPGGIDLMGNSARMFVVQLSH